jgi:predicted ArsR family transcriptional regulator
MRPIPLLEQRRIEAGVLVPLIQAFQAEFGQDETNEVVRRVIAGIARETGRTIGEEGKESPIEKVEMLVPRFNEEGALETDVVGQSDASYDFNVTRCRFAELYQEMGVPEIGFLLSCNRDFALAEGISDDLSLERKQTIMEGAPYCDFRFRLKRDAETTGPEAADNGD